MVSFPFPLQEMLRIFFLALHYENLLEFLKVKSSKGWVIPKTETLRSFLFSSYSTLSLQPFVKIVLKIFLFLMALTDFVLGNSRSQL